MITFGGTKHRHRVARVGAIKFYLGWVTTSFQLPHQKGVGNHIADADVPVRFQVVIKPCNFFSAACRLVLAVSSLPMV